MRGRQSFSRKNPQNMAHHERQTMTHGHPLRSVLFLFVFLAACGLANGQDSVSQQERWYVVRFQGQHAGWMREQVIETPERVTSKTQMHMEVRRGVVRLAMDMAGEFVESPDGKPISASSTQKVATQEVSKQATFGPEGVELVTRQADREHRQQLPHSKQAWLPPVASSRYVEEQLQKGERLIKFHTMDATESLEPYEVTIKVLGPTEIEVFGRTSPAIEAEVTMSHMPGAVMKQYLDEKGNNLKMTMDFGGVQMEMLAADKDLAMAQLNPPELMASTLVKPSFTLLKPREVKKTVYRLRVPQGKMPDLENSVVQVFRRVDGQTIEVDIDLSRSVPVEGSQAPRVVNNIMIAGNDGAVVELMRKATEGVGEAKAERAEAMRRFVHGYMTQAGLNVGMASASEVARTRNGDCTEFGVLLAAMCQADGIPARVASGLIYVPQFLGQHHIFGYHMWTQAWIEGRWVDLDATLPDTAYDAAHILLSTSRMESHERDNSMVTMAPLLGRLRIDLAE